MKQFWFSWRYWIVSFWGFSLICASAFKQDEKAKLASNPLPAVSKSQNVAAPKEISQL